MKQRDIWLVDLNPMKSLKLNFKPSKGAYLKF